MTIVIFIAILVLLILVHELGHFLAAKYFKIRVDEFGIGFPPRLKTLFWWGETRFTLNAIPFGGFVKIFGEDPDEESIEGPEKERSFSNKNRAVQAVVLISGVVFNAILAFVFISVAFAIGIPASEDSYDEKYIKDPQVVVVHVEEDSPAQSAGLEVGDVFLSVTYEDGATLDVESASGFSQLMEGRVGKEILISYERKGEKGEALVVPEKGIFEIEDVAIGVGMSTVGVVSFPVHIAFFEGFKHTVNLTAVIAVELVRFLGNVLSGGADFSKVAGPVGIVGLVGDAWSAGFAFLLYFTAIISLHLTIINLFPFPALDGGRLLFVAIEAIMRKDINPRVANALNGLGFILLILLMIAVTVSDVVKIFN